MNYGLLADLLVVIHAAFVGFVVFGQVAILIGVLCRWQWARNFWFRTTHLLAIGYVAMEALLGLACPLTVWENELRVLAGQPVSDASFVGQLIHNLLFWHVQDWMLEYVHMGFGAMVLLTFVCAPPRLPGFFQEFRRAQSAVSR
jgi:hypothetical protein